MSDNYNMLPNNSVQTIENNDLIKDSFVQLYGKRAIAYFKELVELQNIRGNICFSIDMILYKLNIKENIPRERNYFKEFLIKTHKDSLIIILDENIDLVKLSSSKHITCKLNIYDYGKSKDKNNIDKQIKIKYFMLLDSEYNKIMCEYSGDLDKYNLLNLFCNIKSRIKKNSNDTFISEKMPEVSYPSYKLIMEDIFIESEKTLRKYIDELVSLNLIRFDYAGDMIMKNDNGKPIRRKANFTYILFKVGWEEELKHAIILFKNQKRAMGWSFLSKDKEVLADEKRSITQKINMLNRLSKEKNLTQSQIKELRLLKRKQEKWKVEYENNISIREIEENKLKELHPDKELYEIYDDMGYEDKAERSYNEDENDD